MSILNPLAGTVAGQQLTQASLEAEKVRQVRRAQNVRKNVAAANDRLEHEVESSDAIKPVEQDGHPSADPRQSKGQAKRQRTDADGEDENDPPHIDLKG
jgi:hypothetical protein